MPIGQTVDRTMTMNMDNDGNKTYQHKKKTRVHVYLYEKPAPKKVPFSKGIVECRNLTGKIDFVYQIFY